MNTIKNYAMVMLGLVFAIQIASAQNYKAPAIDASGKFTDKGGKMMGKMTKDGMMDDKGIKVAHVDSEGNLVDSKSGKKLGKVEKNGNFTYHYMETSDSKNFTIGPPAQGVCEVTDDKGNVVLLVHENYKAQAACAYHCAKMKKEGKDMKMKEGHMAH